MGVQGGQALHPEQLLTHHVVLVGIAVGQFTANHQADDLIHGQILGGLGGNPLTVTHDGDVIGNPQDFFHLVGDVDNAAATVPEHVDNPEQVFHFHFRQGGGRFVEHNDFGVIGNCLCNFHHLPLRNRHGAHHGSGIDFDAKLVKYFHGGIIHLLFAGQRDALGNHGEPAQPHVVHDVALQSLVQLLVHHGNTVFQGFLGIFKVDFLAVEEDLASVLLVNAEQTFHQGGLTGTIFAHQGMYRTGPYCQVDTVKGLDAGKFLDDSFHSQQDGFLILFQMFRLLL